MLPDLTYCWELSTTIDVSNDVDDEPEFGEDQDGDGEIEFNEFLELMNSKTLR